MERVLNSAPARNAQIREETVLMKNNIPYKYLPLPLGLVDVLLSANKARHCYVAIKATMKQSQ